MPVRMIASALRRGSVFVTAILAGAASAAEFETSATHAILVDYETGTVLFEKNADALMAPASMSKIMTVYMVFESLRDGRLSLDDTLPVSEKAWRMGGSKMFVEVGNSVRVEDLLRGIIVQSGNDACIVVAEALAGSEEAFAEEMTVRGRELGLIDTVFRNSTGWPHPEHLTTPRDLARLATDLIREFPDYYRYFAEKEFTFSDITQGNRNPLLYRDIGADGLKTGHTEASGYGLTASMTRGDRRLIMVLNGLESVRSRSEESVNLMQWGMREFDNARLFESGQHVDEAEVWLGVESHVPLRIEDDLTITLPRAARDQMKVAVVYEAPVPAPVAEGAQVATLVVEAPDLQPIERPLYAAQAVPRRGLFGRISGAISYLIWGAGG